MTREEALALLGLTASASAIEIQARFRGLARRFHPNGGGTAEAMAQLLAARDIALGTSPTMALVPIDEVRSLVAEAMAAVAKRAEAKDERQATLRRLQRSSTEFPRRLKRIAALTGMSSAVLGLFAFEFLPALEGAGIARRGLSFPFIIFASFAGICYLILNYRIEAIERETEYLLEDLEDPDFSAAFLRELLPSGHPTDAWSRKDLHNSLSEWRRSFEPKANPFYTPPQSRFFRPTRHLSPSQLVKILLDAALKGRVVEQVPNDPKGDTYRFAQAFIWEERPTQALHRPAGAAGERL